MKKAIILLSLASLLILSSCAQVNTSPEPQRIYESGPDIEVYFCPLDDCEGILGRNLQQAEESLHCALFDLDLNSAIDIIIKKKKEIDVKIVLDNDNKGGHLSNINGVIRFDNGNRLSHNKFCIIDNKRLITGSMNPTELGTKKNNNNLLILRSPTLIANYNAEFEELWDGRFGKGEAVQHPVAYYNGIGIENYFCPEDDCKGRIIKALRKAEQSVHFMAFVFTDDDMADTILIKDIGIKGVFDTRQATTQYSEYPRMKDFGIEVRRDGNPATMHHKVFIIDNKTVITGSMNPTASANEKNDENILIIHDEGIAKLFALEFERVWEEGRE
ncbi:TPA: hypothetical protein HA361_03440 [Candidatus Woesearchaeota archaeon]|nr:hypothetical protein [Candidatus Woesearchaeota archaeon]HII69207.1 hypothetical protein [Candidatus Woesearchaeota archaeon]